MTVTTHCDNGPASSSCINQYFPDRHEDCKNVGESGFGLGCIPVTFCNNVRDIVFSTIKLFIILYKLYTQKKRK